MAVAITAIPCTGIPGCIRRTLTIQSNPDGALVELNNQEIGRTPVTQQFIWYGNYDVILRRDGYQTLKTNAPVPAPWWQWIPLDFFTDLLPVEDNHVATYTLKPQPPADPAAVISRAEQLKQMLESSQQPKPATKPTHPTTKPAKH